MGKEYTVEDTETGKTITFEWSGEQPPNDNDMLEVFAEARKQKDISQLEPEGTSPPIGSVGQAMKTNIGVAETGANLVTSMYGVPLSGLAGLFALPFGLLTREGPLETARKTVEGVQKATVYQPQLEEGQQLTEDLAYPMRKLDQAGGYMGGVAEKAGYPNLGAAIHSATVAAPVIFAGGKALAKPSPARFATKVDAKISKAIDHGINKAIRPSVVKKEMHSQVVKYRNKARTAVKEIVANKDNLNILDESGLKVEGLPKTLDQFSQAVEQTKTKIFNEYDALAKKTGRVGVKIDLNAVAEKLESVRSSRVKKDLSPDTISYAEMRMEKLSERGFYTTLETQEAIQMLNQTLEAYYKDPSPQMAGRAHVDAAIANNLRKSLDAAIKKTTGKKYQVLKNKYGALRTLETDVTKRAIVASRKNIKGLLDFSDVYTGYHIAKGIMAMEPSTAVAGGAAKMIAHYMKLKNDPNRTVKAMFSGVEKLQRSTQ